jgi:UDP-3-O-[3-hydroxymyristoyl] N-acetylglucosamine deacetylase/3-hydroxyacyl-[acyl-carrier-protein] dehydratase
MTELSRKNKSIQISEIMKYLPHRYPFLLIDRIVEFDSGKSIVGLKNVTINEPFFQGHFPEHPIMPGVLILEAMAQAGGLLLMDTVENPQDKLVYFMSADKVKWRKPVVPGDQLQFEVQLVQSRPTVCKMKGIGRVEGEVVAEATLKASIVDK